MKFYSYTNNNKDYTMAVSLENLRSIHRLTGTGKSAIRFGVRLVYLNNEVEYFNWLEDEESRKLYNTLIELLNRN